MSLATPVASLARHTVLAQAAAAEGSALILQQARMLGSARLDIRRNNVIHIIFIVAIIVLLVLAASLVAAAIVLCAQHGGVLDFWVQLDPWTVKVSCKKL